MLLALYVFVSYLHVPVDEDTGTVSNDVLLAIVVFEARIAAVSSPASSDVCLLDFHVVVIMSFHRSEF